MVALLIKQYDKTGKGGLDQSEVATILTELSARKP
jgi:hypothetical protein